MVAALRQVPAPGAAAWLLSLEHSHGLRFVVMQLSEVEARGVPADHLAEIGAVRSPEEAARLVADGRTEHVGVVW